MVTKEEIGRAVEGPQMGEISFSDSATLHRIRRGVIIGEMIHEDGRVETFQDDNLIVDSSALLMAQLMKGEQVPGVTHVAVGTGYGQAQGGTQQNPAPATPGMTKLENEIFRKAATVTFNTSEATVTDGTRTNVLEVVVEFGQGEAVGALTEMGLFGGSGASSKDGGTMINAKRFSVWNKPDNATLKWTWRLIF